MVTHNDETFDLCIWDLSIASEVSAELSNIENDNEDGHLNHLNSEQPLTKTFDYPSNATTINLSGHKDEVNCVQFLLPLIVSGSADKTVRLWKINPTCLNQNSNNAEESGVCLRILGGTSMKV